MKFFISGRSLFSAIFFIGLVFGLQGCSGGGGSAATTSLTVTASSVNIKTVKFAWNTYSGATFYKLFVNPDGASGYTLLKDNLTGTSTTITLPVHITDWVNASYIVEAHDGAGKLKGSSPVNITSLMISSIGYLKASNTGAIDDFGYSVSLSSDGTTLAVGAFWEDSNATGVNGTQTDNSVSNAGAVYVFSRSGSTWTQQAYLKASNTGANDAFGYSVSLSSDGNALAVGAYLEDSNATGVNGTQTNNLASNAGAVYVFSRSGSTWTQQAYLKASNTGPIDAFGYSVSLSSDGNALAVGAHLESSNATGVNGTQTDNSASNAGAVYVFSRSGSTWAQQAYLKASNTGVNDAFGYSVSLSSDGSTLAVGAVGEASNATGVNGTQTDNSASNAGAVYLY